MPYDIDSILTKAKKYVAEEKLGRRAGKSVSEKKLLDFGSQVAREFIDFARRKIKEYNLHADVESIFDTLSYEMTYRPDSPTITFEVSFRENRLRRKSLKTKSGRTGEGIDNIIALLNNGISVASFPVRGLWESQNERVLSKNIRQEKLFMQEIAQAFARETKHGASVIIKVADVYGGGEY